MSFPRVPPGVANTVRQFFGVRLTVPATLVFVAVLFCAVFAERISPYDPAKQDYSSLAKPPSAKYLLGTDAIGRDILSRIIYGARVSLAVGVVAIGIALGIGLPVGLVSGYAGGWIDNVVMRLIDAVQAFPAFILALGITAALGPGKLNAMISIGVVSIPTFARLARGETLSIKEREYVAAARVLTIPEWRIVFVHIMPNASGPIIVQSTLRIATAIITEASLSYLGVGIQPPTPSWGGMLRMGTNYMNETPWLAFFPGLAIFVTVMSINIIGDGLRHVMDPRASKERGS